MSDEARELLKRLTAKLEAIGEPEWRTVTKEAREYLERTEPAHPVLKTFDGWWMSRKDIPTTSFDACRKAAMHFYRRGLEDAAGMIKDNGSGVSAQRILDAAGKCPTE